MGIPVYSPTEWVDDSVPAINSVNLNHIEKGINDVTNEAIALRDNPTKAQQFIYGSARMWTTTVGETNTLYIETED